MRTVSVLRPPCLALRAPIIAALLREIRPVAVAGGRVGFAGGGLLRCRCRWRPPRLSLSVSCCPRWDSCEFLGFCPAVVARALYFSQVLPCWPCWLAWFCLLAFFFGGGSALLPSLGGVHAFFVGFRSCRSDLSVAKTKISLFLQLFCDCGSLSVPKGRKWAAKQRILLRFCSFIGIQGSRNNP